MTQHNIVNVEDMAKLHPDTFAILPLDDRRSLRKGDSAKLIFLGHPAGTDLLGGDRMWVKVIDETIIGYVGMLENTPVVVDMVPGEMVCFGPEHVADIDRVATP